MIDLQSASRLKILRIFICLGLIAGIFFSLELWFPFERTFPRAPFLICLPEEIVVSVERLLTSSLVISLMWLSIVRRPQIFLIAAVIILSLLIFFDQMRLQPWVYQYLLFLFVFAICHRHAADESNENQTLVFLQILTAGLYIWSGIQKLNFTFTRETFSFLLAPLENLFPSIHPPMGFAGLAAASLESLLGFGLLFRKTRDLAVWSAIALHLFILGLLIAKGYNSVVWIWNATLIGTVIIAFGRSKTSVKQIFDFRRKSDWRKKVAKLVVVTSVLLPALSFWGGWDMYLSGALFSGNTKTAVIRINDEVIQKLSPKARQNVFQIKSGAAEILPIFEWAMAELNVPVYPEQRVFKQVTHSVCRLAADKNSIELIIKERPAILDGTYQVTRIDCEQIER